MKKENLLISFSGGRTSAYMLYSILNSKQYNEKYNFKIIFANTGKEHEGTLKFVQDCQVNFNCEIIWLEAKHKKENGEYYSKKGWKVSFKEVDFKTASRNGEPFEEMLSVLGIPCSSAPFCSDQLKRKPIESYLKSIGWGSFYKAIGIRIDEIDRVNSKYKEKKIIYPLVSDDPMNKKEILKWWSEQSFDLKVPLNLGNCDICWKKSLKVLVQNTKDFPERFKWWEDMIKKHSDKSRNAGKTITFFREGNTIKQLFEMGELSKKQLDLFAKEHKLDDCSTSCEVYK
tara:strand:+ start:657 stop:1514 length:858 start_codon:yes stop_codon:yes gene_type:complete